jgi:hypothetical protein
VTVQCNDFSVEQQGRRPQCADRSRNRREAFGSILVIPAEQRDLGSLFVCKNPDTVVFLFVNPSWLMKWFTHKRRQHRARAKRNLVFHVN